MHIWFAFLFISISSFASQMPILIKSGPNVPTVSVTICSPGTDNCQTIDNIELDTASTGLRIFSSLITVPLKPVTQNRATIAECQPFAGGDGYWGSIQIADVKLGDRSFSGVTLQTMSSTFAKPPKDCQSPVRDPSAEDSNGILGVAPALEDTCGGNCTSNVYFSCVDGLCTPTQPQSNQVVRNPIGNSINGYTVEFPALANFQEPQIEGVLRFGIDPSGLTGHETIFQSNNDGGFSILFNGNKYWSVFDSGTNNYALSDGSGVPKCSTQKDEVYLCPAEPTTLSAQILDAQDKEAAQIGMLIRNAHQFDWNNNVLDGLAEDWGGEMEGGLVLGVPFFFGKKIFYAPEGPNNPFGKGTFVGYMELPNMTTASQP